MTIPNCPLCQSEHTYHDSIQYVCPDCAHEWSEGQALEQEERVVKDSNGNILANGDAVLVIKDLKLKGSSEIIKKGTKYKNIRLVDGDHDVECGKLQLKSAFLKRA